MKKIVIASVLALCFAGNTLADDLEFAGRIVSIDGVKKTFVVEAVSEQNKMTFASTPMTEYELKNRKIFDDGSFKDLAPGTWVKVEYIAGQNIHTAKEVDIYKD